jgi:DsbE subfamily thiol:disulfide oxidoreductase
VAPRQMAASAVTRTESGLQAGSSTSRCTRRCDSVMRMRKLSGKSVLFLAGLLVVGGSLATVVSNLERRPVEDAVEVEGPMPRIDRRALSGGHVTPARFRGRVTVVNFWASWCGPCRREQPGLERLSKELKGHGVEFVGINFQDDRAAALAYIDEFEVTYPSVADREGVLAYRFGVPYLPATVLVDARGQMRYRLAGAQTETTLRRYVTQLLEERPRPPEA